MNPDFQTEQSGSETMTEQTASSAKGLTRQMCAVPGVPGKPTSCPTYAQPSGPMVTVVGTASASMVGGRPGIELGTSSSGHRATVTVVPSGLTRSKSLPAASARRTSLFHSPVRLFGFDSPFWSSGSTSTAW